MEGKRPGGLTALAVINFILAGLGILGVIAVFGVGAAMDSGLVPTSQMSEKEQADVAMLKDPTVKALTVVSGIAALLLLLSGIGYLKQKKVLGRGLGNTYAVIELGAQVTGLVLMSQAIGIASLIGLIYPLITLVLLNTTFKDDFIN